MPRPVLNLPVLQNWDCHVCGNCCKQYIVTISDEERRRIEAQSWDTDGQVNGLPLFTRSGPFWNRRYQLNRRADGSCIFLSEEGRCRIHERFGYDAKPLPCRLFPFVLVPVAGQWRVGMRYACPSAAANKGRPLAEHANSLRLFASELAKREGLERDDRRLLPPRMQHGQRLEWPDLLRFVSSLTSILGNPGEPLERRMRKCLAMSALCRESRFDKVKGKQLGEFLDVVASSLDAEIPHDPASLAPPSRLGRVLFRQAVAVLTRRDQGPEQGLSKLGRLTLFGAACRFALGRGPVPRMHERMPETTFEKVESSECVLSAEAEQILERCYTTKVESLSFCGAANFNIPFWEGLEMLIATFPVILWVRRAMIDRPPVEAVIQALTIVDDHFGFNRALASRRQRVSFRLLSSSGELAKLIGWYARRTGAANGQ
jgi:lysine-N-methylase